ncbi:MAG: HAD-IC family P-type ATPase, partial [Candidatus Thorarchaeota archaeon]
AFVSLQDGFIGPDGDHEVEAKNQDIQILHIAGLQTDQIKPNQTDKACQKAMPESEFLMEMEHFETFHSKKKMSKGVFRMKDEDSKHRVAVIKGAPDYVMRRCNLEGTTLFDVTSVDQHMGAVTDLDRESWTQRFSAWSSEGLRLIAIAVKPTDREFDMGDQESEGDFAENFVFLGVIAIQDPPRVDVKDHIAVIKGAGVKVHVVTGDFPQTARNIAEQVGILRKPTREELEEGRFLVNATDLFRHKEDAACLQIIEQLFRYSEETGLALIIGRMKPAHKQLFVRAAKLRGEVVAMTGDGSNDAPALRDAHIGVAVGGEDSSELAQAAADMILLDGSFKGIVVAIREGRLGFENILKFLLYLLGTNISEVFFYLSLTFVNIVIALDALNLLVLNLLTDGFPAIALAVENAEGDLMKRNPLRRDTTMLNKFTYVSITVTNVALLASYYVVYLLGLEWHTGDVTGLETDLVADYDEGLAMARMMIVLVINISQLLLAISHRVPDRSIFSIGVFSGKWMNISAFSSIGLIILMTHTPGIMEIMRTEYLDARSYVLVVVMSVLPVIVHELTKVFWFEKLEFNIYKLYEHKVKQVQVLQGVVVERPQTNQKDMELDSMSEPRLPGHIVVQQTEAV